jgi:uncharacterized protein YdeI (YjbR/CyaY-like superfamily)
MPSDAGVDAYVSRTTAWPAEITALRPILLGCGLTEAVKWGKPCYGIDGKNVAIVQEMKDFLALMFFKGALLDDPDGVLEDQGPNSRSARRVTFTSVADVQRLETSVVALVERAVVVERSGRTIAPPVDLVLVDELQQALDDDPELRAGFDRLTPGRQREYDLHVRGAKQAATRAARITKLADRIRAGRGLRDR